MTTLTALGARWHGLKALSRRGAFVVATVSIMHLVQAWLLLIFPDSGGGIALASLLWVAHNLSYNPRVIVSIMMMLCADLALAALLLHGSSRVVRLAMMLPQQTILLIVSGFVMWCTFNQIYADGVERAWPFIFNDQIGWISLALIHTRAILNRSRQAW